MRYSFSSFFRSRRRTFSSVLGVVLAITFLAGTLIAVDSSTRSAFEGFLSGAQSDFSFWTSRGNWTDIRDAVAAVPGITEVAVYQQLGGVTLQKNGIEIPYVSSYGIDPNHLPSMFRGATVSGSLELPRGTVGLTSDVANMLQVSIGDRVTFNYTYYEGPNATVTHLLNLTVTAILTMPQVVSSTGPWIPWYGFTSVVHINDVEWIAQQLVPGAQVDTTTQGEIRIDHMRFLNPYDIDGSRRNLARLERQLQAALVPYEGNVQDNLSYALSNFYMAITIQRIVYLALSLPVIILGVYLGMVGVELGHADRRRELAVLKTRGAKQTQVIGVLILDAILGGVLATIIGIPLGLGLSRLLVGLVNPFATSYTPQYTDIALSSETIITTLVMSVMLMAGVSYRSAKRTATLPIVETLRYYAPGETQIRYRPNTDIILVTLAVAVYGIVFYSRSSPDNFFLFLVSIIFYVMLPFAPILLIVGITRLVTRATGRVYNWTARICKPFAKNLYHIISRNLSRNPRRSANIALIIALGLGFGVFIFANLGSQQALQEAQVRASIGADISIGSPPQNATFRENVSSLPGVAGVTAVNSTTPASNYMYSTIYSIEPDTFFAVTQPESWYFDSLDSENARAVLETGGQVLVSRRYYDENYLAVGDRIEFIQTFQNASGQREIHLNVTIGGVVRALPGTDINPYELPSVIYGSSSTLRSVFEPPQGYYYRGSVRYLVSLQPSADWRSVKKQIQAMGAMGVRVYQEEIEQARSGPVYASFVGFIYIEIAYVVVILTAGLGLIIYSATIEREVEFAAVTARGSSGWQTAGLLAGEAFSIMLIGYIVGVSVGLVTGYLTSQLFFSSFGGGAQTLIPLPFRLPPELIVLIVVAPVAMLLTTLLVSWRVAKMNVAKVLKLRGG